LPLQGVDATKDYYSTAVSPDGTIFMTIYNSEDSTGTLYSSQKPSEFKVITQKTLVERASVSGGGYRDLNGAFDPTDPPCKYYESKYYVLLDQSPVGKASSDYAEVRALLKGHAEFSSAQFVVSREHGQQFLGAELDDADTAKKLGALVSKRPKAGAIMCVEPTPATVFKINLTTGDVIP
jgi:hypothetical protein